MYRKINPSLFQIQKQIQAHQSQYKADKVMQAIVTVNIFLVVVFSTFLPPLINASLQGQSLC